MTAASMTPFRIMLSGLTLCDLSAERRAMMRSSSLFLDSTVSTAFNTGLISTWWTKTKKNYGNYTGNLKRGGGVGMNER